MPQMDPVYKRIILSDNYLKDPLLMALAWKKSHGYIRTTNWYADNFELDKSALNLAEKCREWASEISNGAIAFAELKLIPAPKTAAWTFTKSECSNSNDLKDIFIQRKKNYCLNWQPEETEKIKLRPLAHIGIKEQTIMTLTMMCLANDVETAQGDPTTSYEMSHDKKIVSYGNRLYCTYSEDGEKVVAEHNYGATTIYSKYFTDYRKFLQRPYHFAAKALTEKSPDEEVYLLELDLSQFFDRIDRDKLHSKIKKLVQKEQNFQIKPKSIVENLLNAFDSWSWSECTKISYHLCATKDIATPPLGLPQGLVASGFLSNIYMLDFDSDMAELIGKKVPESNLALVDYCRYVDDMRLVVIGPKRDNNNSNPMQEIQKTINQWLNSELSNLSLKLNYEKSKIEAFRGKSKGISNTLEEIQTRGSGPISFEDTDELISQLESLLFLSENKIPEQNGGGCRFNTLALIEKSIFDVRQDTLKRFAANKISRILNEKRHFTSRETNDQGNPIAGDWDYLQERMARRLVACWSHDPALVLLLKKGLELFPSPKLLEPVLEQLFHLFEIDFTYGPPALESFKKQAVAVYSLSEIFRHSATVIHRKDPQAIPAHADVNAYFEILQSSSAKILSYTTDKNDFCFLKQQARFLLMVRLDTTLETSCGDLELDLILKLSKGFRKITLEKTLNSESIASCILIANQLIDDKKPLMRATSCLLDIAIVESEDILIKIAVQDPGFIRALFSHARAIKYQWYQNNKTGFIESLSNKLYLNVKPSAKPLENIKDEIGIYQLSSRADNPLANEAMALKLMLAIIKILDGANSNEVKEKSVCGKDESNKVSDILADNDIIDLSRTKISWKKSTGFTAVPSYKIFDDELEIKKLYKLPALVDMASHLTSLDEEPKQLQRIALAVRAVLAGDADPTGFGKSFHPRPGYRGLKSTSFKRQLGLMTTPESLVGDNAQFSSWLATLLAKLLRWPGIHVNDQGFSWPEVFTFKIVRELITDRLKELKDYYCQLSGMPVLPELISPAWDDHKRSLTIAMVQSKLPFKNDFSKVGKKLDSTSYREKHRRHVARVAQLIVKYAEAQRIEKCSEGDREQNIDLIVWPELAVNYEDMDILVHLSRKTHSIILAGLVFIDQPGIPGPNNCAVWIVPRKHNGNQNEIKRLQGKFHMMEGERQIQIKPWRPYQLMLELKHPKFKDKPGFKITGAICFDATDIKLSADLRDKSNAFFIPALNRDVGSFDTMVEALHYHMYQPIVLVNTGEFGGSYAMAPYKEQHKRLIAHSTGNNQVALNTFEMNMFDFRHDGVGQSMLSGVDIKTPPAGIPLKDPKK